MIHSLLSKQLRALNIGLEDGPKNKETWQKLLSKISIIYLEQEQQRYLMNRSIEISSREMRERWDALHLLEEQWRSLSECAPDLIIMVDNEGTIVFVNRCRYDVGKDELIGRKVTSLYPEKRRCELEQIFSLVKSERTMKCVEIVDVENAEKHWSTIRVNPVIKSEEVIGILVVETDITEVRKIIVETYTEVLNSFREALF
jgi:PAS domain S-box-containing protein